MYRNELSALRRPGVELRSCCAFHQRSSPIGRIIGAIGCGGSAASSLQKKKTLQSRPQLGHRQCSMYAQMQSRSLPESSQGISRANKKPCGNISLSLTRNGGDCVGAVNRKLRSAFPLSFEP